MQRSALTPTVLRKLNRALEREARRREFRRRGGSATTTVLTFVGLIVLVVLALVAGAQRFGGP